MATDERAFDKVRRKMVKARVEFMSQLVRFSKDELTNKPDEQTWSPLQIANHLYIADGMYLEAMQRVQDEDNPLILAVEEEAPKETSDAELPVSLDAVLGGMAARREEIFEFLAQLPDEAWERPFRHHAWGQLKFYQLVNVLPVHDQMHAAQLAAIASP